ncbi:MAG: M23 family metallopeptidase [Gemmatimonadetes bacterium]|nr:M23 family metallopeptidase [Gemmatimonadota bacterium]
MAAVATYARVAARATRVTMLERENERLAAENEKIEAIAGNLARSEAAYRQIREMAGLQGETGEAGAEVGAEEQPNALDLAATGQTAQSPADGPGVPGGWPLTIKGFRTAGFTGPDHHPGVDIAAPVNTPVVATAEGVVERAGSDPVYGEYVLLRHQDGFTTMYGHNALVLVQRGDPVERGETIAYSGNSGRSTAPHLHYEVRRRGRAVDPDAYLN